MSSIGTVFGFVKSMIGDDFLFVVFTVSVTVVLWYWEYDHVVLVRASERNLIRGYKD